MPIAKDDKKFPPKEPARPSGGDQSPIEKRPPIVVVVGHVDHGKTKLLDYIRKTNIVDKEAGGITQSIGAYEIVHNGQRITFIDTPGHEAFSKMRIRGAHIADVGILVVAADESVKPQTKEALKALQDSGTPFVVAITKIDKPNINIEKVKGDLASIGVSVEGFGGNVSFQGVNSKEGTGINELLDLILLTADMEELKYNPEAPAKGVVLEAKMEPKRGNTVTIILEEGKLKKGDLIATATANGKIKILENFLGKASDELLPSSPAVILGFENLPQIGEEFVTGEAAEALINAPDKIGAKKVFTEDKKDNKSVKVIVKADVAGSLEAIVDLLTNTQLKDGKRLIFINQGVGEISDGDVKDAIASQATIIGFRTSINKAAENLARVHDISILTDEIIYKLIEKLEEAIFEAKEKAAETELEVLAVFNSKANKQTIGGVVNRGHMRIKAVPEIRRDEQVLGTGKVISLQQGKKETNSVGAGNECGLILESDVKIAVGDKLLLK